LLIGLVLRGILDEFLTSCEELDDLVVDSVDFCTNLGQRHGRNRTTPRSEVRAWASCSSLIAFGRPILAACAFAASSPAAVRGLNEH